MQNRLPCDSLFFIRFVYALDIRTVGYIIIRY